jgi:photosystem II stability/assembly factor-like uncharacterized protein
MPNDRFADVLRSANPVTREPTRSIDDAWNDIVATQGRERPARPGSRRRTSMTWTHPRRLLAIAAAVLLIAGVSTVLSIRGPSRRPSLTNSIAQAFGVVNADAATANSFSSTPASPQGFNVLTCPTSEVCYLESTNAGAVVNGDSSVTTAYKTVDGGTTWTPISLPAAGSADTSFSCSSVSVCSVGVLRAPSGSPAGPFPRGTVQSMLTTTDGGATWTSHVVAISPVLGVDPALDTSFVNVQGQWSQLQCFSAASCIAVALVPSDQPQEPWVGGDPAAGVQRTVIMRTDDGGVTWTSRVLPWSTALDGSPGWSSAQLMTLSCATPTNCVGLSSVFHSVVDNAQTSNVLVWRSTDGGVTWHTDWAPAPALDSTLRLTCPTTLQCYATVAVGSSIPSNKNEIMMTNDGGITWTFATPAPTGSTSSIDEYNSVSCTNASTCWIAGEVMPTGRLGSSQAAIWATSDAGKTWMSVPLPFKLGIIFQVVCKAPASCLAVAQPPYKDGQAMPMGPLPGEILSNQSN